MNLSCVDALTATGNCLGGCGYDIARPVHVAECLIARFALLNVTLQLASVRAAVRIVRRLRIRQIN
jgi:hypothetical protein